MTNWTLDTIKVTLVSVEMTLVRVENHIRVYENHTLRKEIIQAVKIKLGVCSKKNERVFS
jgi:hypothetical protein